VVTRTDDHAKRVLAARGLHGSVPGTFEAWLALRGLRTLHLRVRAAQANATELAARLAGHRAVTRVHYPGFGAMLSIEAGADAAAAEAVSRSVRLWVHATSLGGVESSLERRRRWPGESTDVPETLLRLSVGVEDVEDLWADLSRALDAAATQSG
jgi:cystathionine gamma-synthase